MNVKKLIKDFSYSITANLVSLIISVLIVIIAPKVLGDTQYGYWQLYLFYASYVGFFHFGWIDGIYLKMGGKEYDEIDKNSVNSQFILLAAFEIVLTIVLSLFVYFTQPAEVKTYILIFTSLNCAIVIPKTMLLYILQATKRIKEYARVTMIEKISYVIIMCVVLLFSDSFTNLIIIDLFSKVLSLLLALYYCIDIIKTKPTFDNILFKDIVDNIKIGINLLLANIASMLIIGIVKLGIENAWSIEVFGKISLSMSISNMLMIFINAIGVVLYPMLRRTDKSKLVEVYTFMRVILMTIMLGMIMFYYPAKVVLGAWLPSYSESLKYMALMFPICIFESKFSMLINVYMKTLRMERLILFVNLLSVGLSVVLTGLSIFVLNNLELAVISIVVLIAFRSILAELLLAKALDMSVIKDIIMEVVLVICFMATSWYLEPMKAILIYLASYIVYLFINKKEIKSSINMVVQNIKK